MGVKRLEDFVVYQVAHAMKLEIYKLVKEQPAAERDYKFRDQPFEAAKSVENNIAEGYGRFLAGEFVQFLRVAQASNRETKQCIGDGIDRGHYSLGKATKALALNERTGRLLTGLILSLLPYVDNRSRQGRFRDQDRVPRKNRNENEITSKKFTTDDVSDDGLVDGTIDQKTEPRTKD